MGLLLLLAVIGGTEVPAHAEGKGRDATRLYAEFCANCHGTKLEGGKAPGLLGEHWRHGGDEAALLRSIREGHAESGMPGFGHAITVAEAEALIAFIHETARHAIDPPPQKDHPLPDGVQHSQEHDYKIESVAEGLDVPWSMTFLPDGRLLVTERVGRLRFIEHGQLRPEVIGGLPPVVVKDEAGLMSVVADPDYARNGWLYFSFSDPGQAEGTAMTKLIRARLRGWELVDHQTIFSLPPEKYPHSYVLFGSRLVFDGPYLYFSVGVRGLEEKVSQDAQDLSLPNGKIHRVFHDGSVPPDNPFVDRPGAVGSIWAYGVRNPQGLARDPRDGALWESEHGPRGGDELNHIEPGKNYGWPVITYGMNYDGTPITDRTEAPGMEQPIVNWTPSIAASEIEFYTGDAFPKWRHQLFVGSLATQKLLRLVVAGGRVTHTEELFAGLGRVRDVKTGPDGCLYLALELIGRPGRIVRLVPPDSPPMPPVASERNQAGSATSALP